MRPFVLFTVVIALVSFFSCEKGPIWPVHITGDEESIGAQIFINGKKVGIMQQEIHSQNSGLSGLFGVGVDIDIAEGRKKPEYGLLSEIKVDTGDHLIEFVSKDGKRLSKTIHVKSEVYMGVHFKDMSITGGNS